MGNECKNIDLTVAQRQEIAILLKRHLPDTEVWAYGSRVKFTSKPSSDLDMVAFASSAQKMAVYDLKEAFEESDLPFRVDLFIWDEVPEQFHKNIKADRVVLQKVVEKRVVGSELYPEKPLGELVDIYDSLRKPVTSSDRKSGPYPYYGASGITDYVDSFIFEGEHLLLSEDGDNLRSRNTPIAFLADGKFWVNNHAHILQANTANNTEYICYALQIADITSYLSGSTRPKLNQKDMCRIPVHTPPLPEQKAIAHILGSLDDKIELNRRMNATLEGMAQALFKSWFVDFDPVIDNALAAGNPIPEELIERAEVRRKAIADGTANRETAKPFPATFQLTEELGWIPEGWEVGTISDICLNIQNGGTPRRDNDEFWNAGTIPWLTSGEVRQSVITATRTTITDSGLEMSSAKWLPAGSTVVAMYGATAGQVAFVSCKLTTNQAVCGLIPKEHYQHFNYLLIEGNVKHFENQARGSAQQNISKGIIEMSNAILPSIHSVQLFEEQTQPIFKKWAMNLHANELLTNLRDTLLPKLISGELRIPEAEKLAEEALA